MGNFIEQSKRYQKLKNEGKMNKGKKICIFLLLFTLLLPNFIFAEEKEKKEYQDVVAKILHLETKDKIRIYFFHGRGCPHCEEAEIFFEEVEKKYKQVEIVRYEVWYDASNNAKLEEVKSYFLTSSKGVPFIVIGDEYFSGFNTTIKKQIQNEIFAYLGINADFSVTENTSAENTNIKLIVLGVGLIVVFSSFLLLKGRYTKKERS